MDIFRLARSTYATIKDDCAAIEKYRAADRAFADSMLESNGMGSVTSATMNGQSFAMTIGMTVPQKKLFVRTVCRMAEIGSPVSNTTVPLL